MTFTDPTVGPQFGQDAERERQIVESLSHSATIWFVGPSAPTPITGGVKKPVPDWKRWFDTTNKLDKIWSPTHSLWITLTPLMARDDDDGTTTSTTFGNLTGSGVGPAVTIDTGTTVYVDVFASFFNDSSALGFTGVGFAISGATTKAANDAEAILGGFGANGELYQFGGRVLVTGLTAGSNTFTMKYRVSAGTATIQRRNICVTAIPT